MSTHGREPEADAPTDLELAFARAMVSALLREIRAEERLAADRPQRLRIVERQPERQVADDEAATLQQESV